MLSSHQEKVLSLFLKTGSATDTEIKQIPNGKKSIKVLMKMGLVKYFPGGYCLTPQTNIIDLITTGVWVDKALLKTIEKFIMENPDSPMKISYMDNELGRCFYIEFKNYGYISTLPLGSNLERLFHCLSEAIL